MTKENCIREDLEHFERSYSPAGLFARYARERLASFWMRQLFPAAAALVLSLTVEPSLAVFTAIVTISGDAIDCLILRDLARRHPDGNLPPNLRLLSAFGAAIVALSGVASLWLFSLALQDSVAHMILLALTAGGALNAGLTFSYAPRLAQLRLAIYAAGLIALLLFRLAVGDHDLHVALTEIVASLMGAHLIWLAVTDTRRSFARRVAFKRHLLQKSLEVDEARRILDEKDRQTRRLSLVARSAKDSIYITGPDHRIEWVNDTFTRLTGYACEEAVGQYPAQLFTGPDSDPAVVALIRRAVKARQPLRTRALTYGKDGRKLWLETSISPMLGKDGESMGFIAVDRDIGDTIRNEEELARARAAAEEGLETKTRFLATISHELRTPLHGIIGMADLLLDSDLDGTQSEYARTISESGGALLDIVNVVLEVTRLDAGRVEFDESAFDLQDCVRSVVRLLQPVADRKKLSLECEVAQDVPRSVVGDAGRVRQILINLVGNALKFTEEGRILVKVAVGDEGLSLVVQDTGIGIATARLDCIFETFAQEDATITRRFGGTGLGLAISRLLAREMGGDIAVVSTRGAGSTFAVTLPLPVSDAPAEGLAPAVPSVPTLDTVRSLEGLKVLIVEDNRTNRFLITRYLSDTGAELAVAENGRQAVQAFARDRPDVILMDVSMPVMDGIAATRHIRRGEGALPPCPIIGLTANAFEEDRRRCLDAGMSAFLAKPVKRADLLRELCAAVRGATAAGRVEAAE